MLTTVEGVAKGSARSISGFDIYQALNHCQDTLIQFGGHKYAAGLTVDTSRIEDFKTAFGTVARQTLAKELLTPEIRIDGELSLAEVTPEFLSVLADFAPFGPGNSTPIFAVRKAVLYGTPRIVGTNHLKFKVKHSGRVMDAIGFKMGEHLSRLQANGRGIDIACSVEENEYAGDVQPQLKVRDLKFS
jgi:single-stranded-DNA-specific exonuclease